MLDSLSAASTSLIAPLSPGQIRSAVNELYHSACTGQSTNDTNNKQPQVFHIEWNRSNNIDDQQSHNNDQVNILHNKKSHRPHTTVLSSPTTPHYRHRHQTKIKLLHAQQKQTTQPVHKYLPILLDHTSVLDSVPGVGSYDSTFNDRHRHINTAHIMSGGCKLYDMYCNNNNQGPGYYYDAKLKHTNKLASEKHTSIDFGSSTSRVHSIIGMRANHEYTSGPTHNSYVIPPIKTIQGGVFSTTSRAHTAPVDRCRVSSQVYNITLPCRDTRNRHKWSITPRFTYASKSQHIAALANTYRRIPHKPSRPSTAHITHYSHNHINDDNNENEIVIDEHCNTFVTNLKDKTQTTSNMSIHDTHVEPLNDDYDDTVQDKLLAVARAASVDYAVYHRALRLVHLDKMDRIENRQKYIQLQLQQKRQAEAELLAAHQLLVVIKLSSTLQCINTHIQYYRSSTDRYNKQWTAAITIQSWYKYIKRRQLKHKQSIGIYVIIRALRYNLVKRSLHRKREYTCIIHNHLHNVAVRMNTLRVVRQYKQYAIIIQRWYRSRICIRKARIAALSCRWLYVESLLNTQYTHVHGTILFNEARKRLQLPKKMTLPQQRNHYKNQMRFEYISDIQRNNTLLQHYNNKLQLYHKQFIVQYRSINNNNQLLLLEQHAADTAAQDGSSHIPSPISNARSLQPVQSTAPQSSVQSFSWILSISTIGQIMMASYQQLLSKELLGIYKSAMGQILMNINKK